uniref:F-actin-methionine sulfoxide oxidase MICAL3-like n=1 Tax=Monopterus albus TaxID=43700 RepID=UPI0009B3B799
MTVEGMSSEGDPDALSMVMYLSQFYQLFKDSLHPPGSLCQSVDLRAALITPAALLSRLGHSLSRKTNPKSCDLSGDTDGQVCDEAFVGGSRIRLMASQLQAKLAESSSTCRSSAAAALRQQFAVGCSDICFFCKKKVYVIARLSAEGLFFHRSCFQCGCCGSTLRLAAYTYDQHKGGFYCVQHYVCHLNAPTVAKTSTPSASHRTSTASVGPPPSLTSADSLILADPHRSAVASVMVAMAERTELENYRRSSMKAETELLEEPEEVSEETLARFNLNLGQTHNHRSRPESDLQGSSDSDMEEDEEEREGGRHQVNSEEREGGRHQVNSEEARASWRETLQFHLHLRDDEEEEEEGEVELGEEETGSEVESSNEGEYNPGEMERHSGLWLLLEEETEEESSLPTHLTPTVVLETDPQTRALQPDAGGQGPELLQEKPLVFQGLEMESKGEGAWAEAQGVRRRRKEE